MKEFVVTCIRQHADRSANEYYCLQANPNSFTIKNIGNEKNLELLDIIDGKRKMTNEEIEGIAEQLSRNIVKETDANLLGNVKNAKEMNKKITSCCELLVKKLLLSAPIIVRFHNDADGSSGAYALFLAIRKLLAENGSDLQNITWKMHRSIAYSNSDSFEDRFTVNSYVTSTKPLLVLLDFGTSEESNGINDALEEFDILWVDHHPILEGFPLSRLPNYVNPWMYEGNSDLTAGFLAGELAKKIADVDIDNIQMASLIGDHSEYSNTNNSEALEIADLLDMVTSDSRQLVTYGNGYVKPHDINRMLTDKNLKSELVAFSKTHMDTMINEGLQNLKKYNIQGTHLYVVDFEKLREKHGETKYPLPGRYSSKLLDVISENTGEKCVLVLHFLSFISVRISKGLESEIDALSKAMELKKTYSDTIDACGGHRNAFSIKLRSSDDKKSMLRIFLRELGCSIK